MATAKTTAQKKEKQARAAKTLKPADAGKEVKAGKRAERLAKASNVAFSLEPKVRARLAEMAKGEGLELGHYLQKVLETHVLEASADGDELADRLRAKRAVVDHVVSLARELDSEGRFDEHFILTVMTEAASDEGFMELYHLAVGGEGKQAARAQKPMNQQIGRLIRKAAGAKGMRTEEGKVMRGQATGALISSYTLLTR